MAGRRGDYDRHRESMAGASRERSASGRDIGPIPPIADVARRERCRYSLREFCETYNPAPFYFEWADFQLEEIARIEEAVLHGAMYAFAEPRGSGKTVRVRMAALWAVSYGYWRYAFVIGATDEKASDHLSAIKTFIRFLPEYAADFPEISYPVQQLAGIANRASGQTCQDRPTLIEWRADCVVLPQVPPPSNWPEEWPLRSDGLVPTSGGVIGVSGLTGEGIRGSLKTLSTGEQIRPDGVLIDDPQTRKSARSRIENVTRLELVNGDVLGMAGPGRTISAVMPCTVIEPGDFIDQTLNRSEHPLWRGERVSMLKSMPADLGAWDEYFEVYRRCVQSEPPDFTEANEYYVGHREKLDAGAEATWPARKLDWEVSAIQSAMHLYFRNRRIFWAEYQNKPLVEEGLFDLEQLEADYVCRRLNNMKRGVIPRDCSRLTCGIDVQARVLFWMVHAWDERFGGSVVDYGAWPKQHRSYFTKDDARPTLAEKFPKMSEDARIYLGLKAITAELLERPWSQHQTGAELRIERCLIDSGWKADVVHKFCRNSPHSGLLTPSKGKGVRAGDKPFSQWARKPGDRVGHDWRIDAAGRGQGRFVLIDTNSWKSFVANGLLAPEGSVGCIWVFGSQPHAHQLLADHLSAEWRQKTEGRGRKLEQWQLHPGVTENHWFDCQVMCAVGASMQGLVWNPAGAAGEPDQGGEQPKKKMRLSDMQAQKRKVRA